LVDNRVVDERGKRIGQNESVFREVNERLRKMGETFSLVAERAEFICECGNSACVEQISMALADYERVRSDPKWFVLAKGHEESDYERLVFEGDTWVVVEKLPGGAAGVAISTDPRDRDS
jgi:hypothetical protein